MGAVKDVGDLYYLDRDKLIKLIGQKRADKILASIEKSKG